MLDYSTILTQLLQIWWVVPLFFMILFFQTSFWKGILGERLLNFFLNISLNKEDYKLLYNITLPTENGTTQIDHILVSVYGIFVIETKNYKGWIFGSETQKMWIQSIYGTNNKFQNPIHQNYKHIKELQKLLNLEDEKLFSLIVFGGESTFKTKMPANVVYPMGAVKYIKSQTKKVFTNTEIDTLIDSIEGSMLQKSFKTDREHVNNLKTRHEIKKSIDTQSNNSWICPKCSSPLVLRVAKRGQNGGNEFYGCSNYPKCKYTQSI